MPNRKRPVSLSATSRVNTPILARIALREPHAFEDFIKQYRPLLSFLIRKSVGSGPRARSESDDAMQEACVAVWQAADRFDPARGSEKTFISMLTRRRLIDRFYRRCSRITTLEFASDAMDERIDLRDSQDDRSSLPGWAEHGLAALAPESRHLLEQSVVHGRTSTEIAQATGMGINTVKTRIHRALARLRSCAAKAHELAAA